MLAGMALGQSVRLLGLSSPAFPASWSATSGGCFRTSNFLPTLEKEKLQRLFKDFPDLKNRHSSEHYPPAPGG